jgi:biopolymer transport protein ExbD
VISENSYVSQRTMSITDKIQSQLSLVQRNYGLFDDIADITIGATGSIKYDYLVQLMDSSRKSGFENISFSKIRS